MICLLLMFLTGLLFLLRHDSKPVGSGVAQLPLDVTVRTDTLVSPPPLTPPPIVDQHSNYYKEALDE
ncbi:MAG: hypothetical protein [Arizlama microvirus]|nr:MAG: hypothetical protein [Arizlama microvirus]